MSSIKPVKIILSSIFSLFAYSFNSFSNFPSPITSNLKLLFLFFFIASNKYLCPFSALNLPMIPIKKSFLFILYLSINLFFLKLYVLFFLTSTPL